MRPLVALLLLASALAVLPTASAAAELPVFVRVTHDETVPGDDGCHGCFGATVGVSAGMSGCCDLPSFGVLVDLSGGEPGGSTDLRVAACYTSLGYRCYIDETLSI
jgi:hypothetical protein